MKQYAFGKSVWKDMEIVSHKNYDRLIILTRPYAFEMDYDPNKAITMLTEPPGSPNIIEHKTSAIIPMYLPLPFWHKFSKREWGYVNTEGKEKTELLSAVTSDLIYMEGHAARLQIISLLDKVVVEGFDLWGKAYNNNFFGSIRSYKGEIENKYNALWRYQYHFSCENSFTINYFTEKLVDPIIAECLCFYDGCRNIEKFIDERAFIRIDVFDPLKAIETIVRAIENQEWDKRIVHITAQKKRLISTMNPLNIIWLALKGKDVVTECSL